MVSVPVVIEIQQIDPPIHPAIIPLAANIFVPHRTIAQPINEGGVQKDHKSIHWCQSDDLSSSNRSLDVLEVLKLLTWCISVWRPSIRSLDSPYPPYPWSCSWTACRTGSQKCWRRNRYSPDQFHSSNSNTGSRLINYPLHFEFNEKSTHLLHGLGIPHWQRIVDELRMAVNQEKQCNESQPLNESQLSIQLVRILHRKAIPVSWQREGDEQHIALVNSKLNNEIRRNERQLISGWMYSHVPSILCL